ncbi:hypothetical protein HXX76_004300 [Chlamydomonas incerta]|uniref:SnoaL-like domain-containing protein n=1 Tax=Chlamydomonas incerta TaxID=51695 RepID=A0A835W4E6_CHLIN|nr:hypothetical protein HXX76_004300 [Chlamydomonas incerta]|eukprot:KAG2440187.1 hypothetical protein HXX76_004300 [Chlamydomonas incerta]
MGRVPRHVNTARPGPRAHSQQPANRIIAQAVPPQSRGAPTARAVGSAEAPTTTASVAPAAGRCDAFQSAKSLFEALNRRDVSAVLSLMSEEVVYDSLSTSASLRGRAAVGRFYLEALAAIPENAVFVLEPEAQDGAPAAAGRRAGSGDGGAAAAPVLQAGVAWHMELNGAVVPLSRGMGVYWADTRTGLLTRVWENPEPAFKAAQPLLTSAVWASASPLLGGLTRGVSSLLNTLGSSSTNGSPVSSSDSGSSGGGFGSVLSNPGVPSLPDMASVLGGMLPFGGPPASPAAPPGSGSQAAAGGKAAQQRGRSAFSDHSGRVTTAPIVATPQGARSAGEVSNGAWAAAAAAAAAKQAPAVVAAVSAPAAPAAPAAGSAAVAAPAAAAPAVAAPAAAAPVAAATAAAASAAAAAAPSAAPAEAVSSKGDPILMRQLSETEGPSTSTSSSTGEESSTPASASSSATAEPAATASTAPAAAVPAPASPILLPAAGSAAASSSQSTRAAPSGSGSNMNSFASVDDGGDAPAGSSVDNGAASGTAGTGSSASVDGGAGGGGGWKLPFDRSYSMVADLTSLWEKDGAASQVEEYEAMLDVLELGGLQKVTARLIDGLDLKQGEDKFEVSFVTIVPFFRVTEKSRFTAATAMMRRDLRGGRQSSIATRVPGGVEVKMTWDNPLAGSLTEEYVVSEDGAQLAVTSAMRIGPRAATATQIYRRSNRNRNEFLNQQRSSYGSMEDVLKKQEQKYGKIKY